ncbi:UPF0183 protein, partial [Mucuna pruriens]
MDIITLNLCPSIKIKSFSLRMPIYEAFAQIEQQPNLCDVVHVKYFDEEPLKLDIIMALIFASIHGLRYCALLKYLIKQL